ncbi:MAG TPA: methyltransferase domain-containing protein [Gemmatimonadaceae bacterium]|nr:methyltransferase domain-containing protein [Gemmatimonadaceae bacterium]
MGHLRSVEPVSRDFGTRRGRAIDRYYIEDCFLARHASHVRGRVLEIGDASYTRQFGGDRVTRSDVLHAVSGNPSATMVGDLATGEGLETEAFDCVILTQTLLVIYDLHAAMRVLHRILAPGGVALVTVPGISQIARNDMNAWGDYWRFTEKSARRLFEETFDAERVQVSQWGNVLAATCFLQGIAFEEVTRAELDHPDADYPVTIGIVARKAAG